MAKTRNCSTMFSEISNNEFKKKLSTGSDDDIKPQAETDGQTHSLTSLCKDQISPI
jgi:hypothetical protein